MSKSQYGRFIVSRILALCKDKRADVIKEFYGKVRKLIRHKEASIILDEAYSQYANSAQRISMMEEFYGPEFAVFKSADNSHSLEKLLDSQPLKKPYILKHMRSVINSVLEKGSISIGQIPILHRAINDYLRHSDPSVVSKDMIELLKDHLVHILHTKEGSQIANYCILHAGPKDRKHIIKSFKGFVHSIAKEQYGNSVLITLFECVDDTVLLSKSIISELFKSPNTLHTVGELLRDKYGSRVLLFIISGRNKRYQSAHIMDELESCDKIRKITTKKDDDLRSKQILEAVSPLLIEAVLEHFNELARDKNGSEVILECIKSVQGNVQPILDTIIDMVRDKPSPSSVEEDLDAGSKEEKKPSHVIKKLRAEQVLKRQSEQGLNMTESLLVNRHSTALIKHLLKLTNQDWHTMFIKSLWEVLKGEFENWMLYCAKHEKSSGTCFIFIAIYENSPTDDLKKIMKCSMNQAKVNKLKSLVYKDKNEIKKKASAGGDSGKKRKHCEQDKKNAIQVMIDYLL